MRNIFFYTILSLILFAVSAEAKSPPPGSGVNDIPANILIMLDTSGSMNSLVSQGSTRYPMDMVFDSAGNLYVSVYFDTVEKFNAAGEHQGSFGGYDGGTLSDGKFDNTFSIAIDSNDYIYVSDYNNGRVQKFTTDGTFVSKINITTPVVYGIEIDSDDNLYAVNHDGEIEKYDSHGNYIKTFNNGKGFMIAIDSSDNIYIARYLDDEVEKYDSDGNFIASFSFSFGPFGIDIAANGDMYISDYTGAKVYRYDSSGSYIDEWGSYGSGTSNYKYPFGIKIDSSGTVWVADYHNHRVKDIDDNLFTASMVTESRLDQAKNVIKSIVSNSELTGGANFGLMEWSTHANMVVNVSSSGAGEIFNQIDSISAGGLTRLDDAMDLAESYFLGSYSPMDSSITCQQNLLIVVSDGYWVDNSASDTAETLYEDHGITTFTVGFQTTGNSNYVTLSQKGGTYPDSPLYADNWQTLLEVLSNYILNIITSQFTFTAPTVMPGVFNTDNILQSTFSFKQDHQWKGHLYKYALDNSGLPGAEIWDAGELLNLKPATSRNIWTVSTGLTTGLNNFITNNRDRLRLPMEENSGSSYTDAELDAIIDFTRGIDSYSEFPTGVDDEGDALLPGERWKLADIYHSRAALVGPPSAFVSDEININSESYYRYLNGYNTFKHGTSCGSTCTARDEMIYVGSNGGMLHAFDAATGDERWAFIPPSVLPSLKDMVSLRAGESTSIYAVDGSPIVKDIYYDGSWKTILISGLRQGGQSYFALDITDPDNPEHLFTIAHNFITNTVNYWNDSGVRSDYTTTNVPANLNFFTLGESWSDPAIVNIETSPGMRNWVAVIAGGFNNGINPNYGAQLFILDLEDGGKILQNISLGDSDSGNNIVNSVPPRVTLITSDTTSTFTDIGAIAYVNDLEGRMWKVNLSNNGILYEKTKLLNTQASVSNGRASFHEISSSIAADGTLIHFFGSGDMQNIETISSSIDNRVYGIWDTDFPSFTSVNEFTTSSLADMGGTSPVCPVNPQKGWYFDLNANEKVTAKATTKNSIVLFPRFTPNSTNVCEAGSGKITEHDFACGTLLRDTPLGYGMPTEAVIYKNKIYIGVSSDSTANLPEGFIKQGNLIVGTPVVPSLGTVKIESWWVDF